MISNDIKKDLNNSNLHFDFFISKCKHQMHSHEMVTTVFTFVDVVLFSASIYSSFLCLDIIYCHAMCRNFTALKH